MLIIPIVAFGDEYVARARWCIASLQSSGNWGVDARIIVYTDQPAKFSAITEVIDISGMVKEGVSKHTITTRCYKDALHYGYPIVPISPDMTISGGALRRLSELSTRFKAVLVPVLRVTDDTFPYDKVFNHPRELCAEALRHLHPLQAQMFIDNMPGGMAPTSVFRRVDDMIVARCFHMHPLMLKLSPDTYLEPTIDGALMGRLKREDCYVVRDSDEMMVVDLTARDYNWSAGHESKWPPETTVVKWAQRKTNPTHRWFFTDNECVMHASGLKPIPSDPRIDALVEEVRRMK
jgi:hypothetical protein